MKVNAVIDELEEHHAVLLVGPEEVEVDWPVNYLPTGAKEGDIIDFELGVDAVATKRQKQKVTSLIKKLKNK